MTFFALAVDDGGGIAAWIEAMPTWQKEALLILGILLGLLVVVYSLIRYALYRYRKAYNLTKAETAKPDKGLKPAFLEVDHKARAEAIKRGDEYVRPADRPAPDEVLQKAKRLGGWGVVCRIAAVLAAIAHGGILVIALLDHTKDADTVWQEITTADRLAAVWSKYWLGLSLASIVIVAQIVLFISSRRRKA